MVRNKLVLSHNIDTNQLQIYISSPVHSTPENHPKLLYISNLLYLGHKDLFILLAN